MCKKEKVTYLRCSLPKCDNPLIGKKRKFCSKECTIKSSGLERKAVYAPLDGYGGPRSMVSESSIKRDEGYIIGNGAFVVDDYAIDPDIFAIAELNHEIAVEARNEHEARVVIDGLLEFQKAYNEHHEENYGIETSRKYYQKNKSWIKLRSKRYSRQYYQKNKERITAKARTRYKVNPSYIKQPDLYKHEKWLKRKIFGS